MSTAKQAMYSALSSSPGLAAIVGSKIFPDQALEGIVEPYVQFSVVSDIQIKGMRGPIGKRKVRFQIEAFCSTRLQAETIEPIFETLFDGIKFGDFGGLTVDTSIISTDEGAVDDDDPPRPGEDSGLRNVRVDVLWWI